MKKNLSLLMLAVMLASSSNLTSKVLASDDQKHAERRLDAMETENTLEEILADLRLKHDISEQELERITATVMNLISNLSLDEQAGKIDKFLEITKNLAGRRAEAEEKNEEERAASEEGREAAKDQKGSKEVEQEKAGEVPESAKVGTTMIKQERESDEDQKGSKEVEQKEAEEAPESAKRETTEEKACEGSEEPEELKEAEQKEKKVEKALAHPSDYSEFLLHIHEAIDAVTKVDTTMWYTKKADQLMEAIEEKLNNDGGISKEILENFEIFNEYLKKNRVHKLFCDAEYIDYLGGSRLDMFVWNILRKRFNEECAEVYELGQKLRKEEIKTDEVEKIKNFTDKEIETLTKWLQDNEVSLHNMDVILSEFPDAKQAYKLAVWYKRTDAQDKILSKNPQFALVQAVRNEELDKVQECLKKLNSLDDIFICYHMYYDDDDAVDLKVPILKYAVEHCSANIVKALMEKANPDVNVELCKYVIIIGNMKSFEKMLKGFVVTSPEMKKIVLEVLKRKKDWLKLIKESGYKIQDIQVLSQAFETDFGRAFAEGITDIKDYKPAVENMISIAVKNNMNQVLENLLGVCKIDEQRRKELLKEAMSKNYVNIFSKLMDGYTMDEQQRKELLEEALSKNNVCIFKTLIRGQKFDLKTIVDYISKNDSVVQYLLEKDHLKIDTETKLDSPEDCEFLLRRVLNASAFDFFQELIKSDALAKQVEGTLKSKNEWGKTFLHKVFEDWATMNYSPFDKKGLIPKENTYQINILRKLIEIAGDLSQKDANGDMLLHCAARCRCCGAFDSLESWSVANTAGKTPLTELVTALLVASNRSEFMKASHAFEAFMNSANMMDKISLEDRYQAVTLLSGKVMEGYNKNSILQLITTKRKSQLLCMAVDGGDTKVIDELMTFFKDPHLNQQVIYKNNLLYALETGNVSFLKFILSKEKTWEVFSQTIDELIKSDNIKKLITIHRAVFYLSKDYPKEVKDSLEKLTQRIVKLLFSLDKETMNATLDEVKTIDHEQAMILMGQCFEDQRRIKAGVMALDEEIKRLMEEKALLELEYDTIEAIACGLVKKWQGCFNMSLEEDE